MARISVYAILLITMLETQLLVSAQPAMNNQVGGTGGTKRPKRCNVDADITFVLDASSSINLISGSNFFRVKRFVKSITERLNVSTEHTRIAMVTFATNARIEFNLTTNQTMENIKASIDRIPFRGRDTNIADGLMETLKVFNETDDRQDTPKLAVLIMDTFSNIKQNEVIPNADLAKEQDIRMISIGLDILERGRFNETVLEAMRMPNSKVESIFKLRVRELPSKVDDVVESICKTVGAIECPRLPSIDNWWTRYTAKELGKGVRGMMYCESLDKRSIHTCMPNGKWSPPPLDLTAPSSSCPVDDQWASFFK